MDLFFKGKCGRTCPRDDVSRLTCCSITHSSRRDNPPGTKVELRDGATGHSRERAICTSCITQVQFVQNKWPYAQASCLNRPINPKFPSFFIFRACGRTASFFGHTASRIRLRNLIWKYLYSVPTHPCIPCTRSHRVFCAYEKSKSHGYIVPTLNTRTWESMLRRDHDYVGSVNSGFGIKQVARTLPSGTARISNEELRWSVPLILGSDFRNLLVRNSRKTEDEKVS